MSRVPNIALKSYFLILYEWLIGSWLQFSVLERWSLLVEISSMHPEFEEEVRMCPWQSCMHGRCGLLIVHVYTGIYSVLNPHKTSRGTYCTCMHTHAHTKRKRVIMAWKHQKHMRKSALKQCPLRHYTTCVQLMYTTIVQNQGGKLS